MATGGRVLHHLRRRLGDERTTVLLAGYQAAGTRGRLLRDGATTLRIFGEEIPVRAKILATDALSAHADQREILRWLRQLARPPQATWAVHGEPDAAAALRDAIARDLGWARCCRRRRPARSPSDSVRLVVLLDAEALAETAATLIANRVTARPDLVMAVPAGRTPRRMYERAARSAGARTGRVLRNACAVRGRAVPPATADGYFWSQVRREFLSWRR